jgi:hypothetical protein
MTVEALTLPPTETPAASWPHRPCPTEGRADWVAETLDRAEALDGEEADNDEIARPFAPAPLWPRVFPGL